MTEKFEAQKMSEYEMNLKLDRMTQRAFGDKIQKPPKKPLSTVDIEVIKEYQKQFNKPVREYETEIDVDSGEEKIVLNDDGTPKFKIIAKKFRVVPPPDLDVVENLEILPSSDELRDLELQFEELSLVLQVKEKGFKELIKIRKEIVKSIDELPQPSQYIEIEKQPTGISGISEVSSRIRNPNYERQKQATELEKERRVAKINQLDDDLNDLNTEIIDISDHIEQYNIEKARLPQMERENQAKISSVKKINSERVKSYQETLNLMNRGAFQQDQMPDESEEDYLSRLQQNAEQEYIDETKFEAEMDIKKKFKEALKKLIRDDIKIEQVANSIRTNEIGIKNNILKKFSLFKKKFTDLYGINNPSVEVIDIKNFIDAFTQSLKGNETLLDFIAPNLEEREIEYGVEVAEKDPSKVHIMTNPANDRKLYWRLAEYTDDYFNVIIEAIYSLTGKRESYTIYSARKDGKRIRDATGFTTANIKQHFENKPIEKMLDKAIERSSEEDEDFELAKEPTDIANDYIIGWGIKEQEIPDMVQFGKVKIALNKLFFKNILSVRHNNLGRIAGFPNVKVSDDFVAIIMKLSKGDKIIKQEIDSLQKSEQILYDSLLSLANLNKKIPNNQNNTIQELKNRMDTITGLMEAGNDNKLLVKELYQIVHSLKSFGVITNGEANKYLSQF